MRKDMETLRSEATRHRRRPRLAALQRVAGILALALPATGQDLAAQETPTFAVELEAGPVWQSRNEVQVPNDATGTRFSLAGLLGRGPWPAGRLYATWNVAERHSLRLLAAPLSVEETGSFSAPVSFAGQTFQPGTPIIGTYRFNSWRLTYRYRLREGGRLRLWTGFSAKIRDAKIQLRQGSVTAKDTDVGFVPLLHLAARGRLSSRWNVLLDLDGLAGGPGRALDTALKVGYDLDDRWSITAGYRTLEGGADVESVYAFAWLHYGVISGVLRF